MKRVTGTHVAFLDGDDYFVPDKIRWQYEAFVKMSGIEGVFGNFSIVDPSGVPIRRKWVRPPPSGDVFTWAANATTGILRTLLVRYELVRQVGFMNPNMPMYDGLWLTIQLSAICRFAYLDELLIGKRDLPSGASKTHDATRHLHDLRLIYQFLQPLLYKKATDSERVRINETWRQLIEKFDGRHDD